MSNEKQRKRLIELLSQPIFPKIGVDPAEVVADYLLDNGLIVPPCKVGDTVYILDVLADNCKCADCDYYYAGGMGDLPECEKTRHGYRYHKCVEIIEQRATMQSILCWLSCDDFGKTVFLTREEAEKSLSERSNHEREI